MQRTRHPRLVSYKEISAIYGMSRWTVSKRVKRNGIQVGKIGRQSYCLLDERLHEVMSKPLDMEVVRRFMKGKDKSDDYSGINDSFRRVDKELLKLLA